ncbi:sensor histidine kinase [Eubacterium aggregans]|uniref:sensor histidine kinase n=1 Tax=Eubacterium aggregans TaxID=81409 RepID=UPI0023F20589|nr:GHKL domain-containing protein [Eubacterium aggregans]MDD4692739.1 GHKL domain-containing protein [Eubacterium aggregans]
MIVLLSACLGYWVQILPSILLLVFLFSNRLRLTGMPLVLALTGIVLIPGVCFAITANFLPVFLGDMPTEQVRFMCFAFFMILTYLSLLPLFDESLSRKLFFFGVVCNYSQVISTLAMLIERTSAVQTISSNSDFFSMTNSLISVWLLVFTFPFVFYILSRRYPLILESVSDRVWGWLAFASVIEFGLLSFGGLLLPLTTLDAFSLFAMSGIILNIVLLYVYVYSILKNAWQQTQKTLEEKQARFLLDLQTQRMKDLHQAIADTRQSRHDLRHHLQALSTLASQEDGSTAEERLLHIQDYLKAYTEIVDQREFIPLCHNLLVDSLLNYYRCKALDAQVSVEIHANLPEISMIPDPLLCIILGNLLENALDATMELPPGEGRIQAIIQTLGENLIITVDNTFNGDLNLKGNIFHSTKATGSGLGLLNVSHTAESYGGNALFEGNDQTFHASVILPVGGPCPIFEE